jgi:hypothetical protein
MTDRRIHCPICEASVYPCQQPLSNVIFLHTVPAAWFLDKVRSKFRLRLKRGYDNSALVYWGHMQEALADEF